jgi:hypothetical protein
MVKVQDVYGLWEVDAGHFPNPRSPVSEINGPLSASKTSGKSLSPQQGAEVLAALKGSHIGRGVVVALGLAFRVRRGLGKNAAQL